MVKYIDFMSFTDITNGLESLNKTQNLAKIGDQSCAPTTQFDKGLEDFSANPVTLRGNILRM